MTNQVNCESFLNNFGRSILMYFNLDNCGVNGSLVSWAVVEEWKL